MRAAATSKPVTIREVAAAAGVSRAAVSKVIREASGVSPAMRSRVQAAIQDLNYRPSSAARSMRGSSFTLGIELPHLVNPFLNDIADGACERLSGTPYHLVVTPAGASDRSAIEALIDHRVDGIVAISPQVPPERLEEVAGRIPLVMVGRHDQPAAYDTVVGDDVGGVAQAMDHLLQLGHRRIAHLTEPPAVTAEHTGTPHSLRLRTYVERMRAAGLDHYIRVVHVDNEERGAHAAMAALLAQTAPPTAVLAGHDLLALGALAALADAGMTAREVSVVGYDDITLAQHPLIALTSVHQSGNEFGRQAVSLLLERVGGRSESRGHTIPSHLVTRRSSTQAP